MSSQTLFIDKDEPNTANLIAYVGPFIQDAGATTPGDTLTGLDYTSASLTAYYVRAGDTTNSVTLATQTIAGAYNSGGFVEVDGTNMRGMYRFDIPSAVVAGGVDLAIITFDGYADLQTHTVYIKLRDRQEQSQLRTTIATLTNQTSMTLTTGSADNDAYNDWVAVIVDATTAVQTCAAVISDYVGTSKTITLAFDPAVFTMAAGDYIALYPPVGADTRRINGNKVVGDGNATPWDGA